MAINNSNILDILVLNTTTGGTNVTVNLSSPKPLPEPTRCGEFMYNFHENIGLTAVFGVYFIIGLVSIFAGYRLYRFTLFVQPLSVISTIVYQVLSEYVGLTTLYSALAAGGGGIAIGLIATFSNTLGLFGISLVQGAFLGTCVLYVLNIFIEFTNVFIPPTIVLVCFVFLAIPTIKYEKKSIILYSASYGTAVIMLTIDYFLNLSMLRKLAYQLLVNRPKRERTKPCWFSWTLFAFLPVIVSLGCLVQSMKTGKHFDHKDDHCCRKRKREPSVHLLSSKNDVISKTWIYGPSTAQPKSERDEDEVHLMEEVTSI